ncbi:MAG: hypothetical protein V4507_07380 [Verrucomicrobiota bacterium]
MKRFDGVRLLFFGLLQVVVLAAANPVASTLPKNLASNSVKSDNPPAPIIFKNLARYHVGTILEKFDPETRYYLPDPSAEAWLDEDDVTSYALPTGKHWYLITLEEPALIQNFALAADKIDGKISLYASDQRSLPGAKNWEPLLKDVSAQELNDKEYARPLYRYARYFLLETELQHPAEISSLYLFTDSDAVNYKLQKRTQPTRFTEKAGPFFKDTKGQINFASRYARDAAIPEDSNVSAMTDESPETTGVLDQKPTQIDLTQSRAVERISIFAEKKNGVLTVSLEPDPSALTQSSGYLPDSLRSISGMGWGKLASMVVQLNGTVMGNTSGALTRTIRFDGTKDRISIPVPVTESRFASLTWVSSETPASPLKVRNLSFMGYISLNDYQVQRGFVGGRNDLTASKENPVTNEEKNKEGRGETTGQTGTSTTLGNQIVKTADQLNLPPVTPVSN